MGPSVQTRAILFERCCKIALRKEDVQDAVRWQPYCVFDPLGFEKLINFGIGETRVGRK